VSCDDPPEDRVIFMFTGCLPNHNHTHRHHTSVFHGTSYIRLVVSCISVIPKKSSSCSLKTTILVVECLSLVVEYLGLVVEYLVIQRQFDHVMVMRVIKKSRKRTKNQKDSKHACVDKYDRGGDCLTTAQRVTDVKTSSCRNDSI
jgi:hypothetical protein